MNSIFTLLIDIGNSRIKWLFQPIDKTVDISIAPTSLSHHDTHWLDSLKMTWAEHAPKPPIHCVISNVADHVVFESVKALITHLYPNIAIQCIEPQKNWGSFTLAYNEPKQMGSDRFAQLLGAQYLCPNVDHVIVSAGTATTIDGVLTGGQHIGGAIMPSIHLMRASLHQYTTRLPLEGGKYSSGLVPINTVDALAVGTHLATIGAVTTFISTYMPTSAVQLMLCGGGANELATDLRAFTQKNAVQVQVVPALCLLGLWCYQKNKNA